MDVLLVRGLGETWLTSGEPEGVSPMALTLLSGTALAAGGNFRISPAANSDVGLDKLSSSAGPPESPGTNSWWAVAAKRR